MTSVPTVAHHDVTSATTGSGALVELTGVSRSFGTVKALDGFDLRINPGELIVTP